MKVSDYLIKKSFRRRTLNYGSTIVTTGFSPTNQAMKKPTGRYEYFNQDKILDELHSGSHIIYNCSYRSMRPKYKWNPKEQKNELDGYEDVTRNAVSWQEAISSNKTATCGGNPPWIGNESGPKNADRVSEIKSHINVMNLQSAILSHFDSIFRTGDGALYFYIEDNNIRWKSFSYENGENCTETMDYENPEEKMGVRYFDYESYDAAEFYRNKNIELYIKFPDEETMRSFFPNAIGTKTEDDYYLIRKAEHGLDESPFAYHREKDAPWGPVQNNIEDYEKTLSDVGENVKYYAYQILFLTGGAMSLPNANFGGKVIGSKNSDGKAEILAPADASNILDVSFKKTYNAICDGSKSVFIKPDELKGQNDSGAYIANLYWPEIQFATLFYARYSPCMSKILSIIKKLVGAINNDIIGYSKVRLSYMFEPFIPKNKLEESTILQQGVTAGYLSKETATEESSSANPLEMERLRREAKEKIEMEKSKTTEEI